MRSQLERSRPLSRCRAGRVASDLGETARVRGADLTGTVRWAGARAPSCFRDLVLDQRPQVAVSHLTASFQPTPSPGLSPVLPICATQPPPLYVAGSPGRYSWSHSTGRHNASSGDHADRALARGSARFAIPTALIWLSISAATTEGRAHRLEQDGILAEHHPLELSYALAQLA